MPLSGNKLKLNQIRGAGSGAQPISISGGDGSHTGTCAPVIQAGATVDASVAAGFTLTGPQHCGGHVLTPDGAYAITTLTGAQLDAYFAGDVPVGSSWDLVIVNLGTSTNHLTLTAGASGVVVSGTAQVDAGTEGIFKVIKDAAASFIFRRLDA